LSSKPEAECVVFYQEFDDLLFAPKTNRDDPLLMQQRRDRCSEVCSWCAIENCEYRITPETDPLNPKVPTGVSSTALDRIIVAARRAAKAKQIREDADAARLNDGHNANATDEAITNYYLSDPAATIDHCRKKFGVGYRRAKRIYDKIFGSD
jgi:hypothetical protein